MKRGSMGKKVERAISQHTFIHHTWRKVASRIKLRMDDVAMPQPPSHRRS